MGGGHVVLLSFFSCSIRRELSLALERERSVEQSKAQLELDWQQRVGEVERQQSHKHQELIRQLSRARDEVCRPVCLSVCLSILADTSSLPHTATGTS